jgi:hypothetical protein
MSVWLCIPSKRSLREAEPVLEKWREMGYNIALVVDNAQEAAAKDHLADCVMSAPEGYRGYARSVNGLIAGIIANDITAHGDQAEWFVAAGDDTLPDSNKRADEIAEECSLYFAKLHAGSDASEGVDLSVRSVKAALNGLANCTFGVMQPTGDPWSDNGPRGDRSGETRMIRRVAGSPWLGREWCLRANKGKGPLWPEFFHMFADEALQSVAQKLGVFWQREDLTHLHMHWGRPKPGGRVDVKNMPEFLQRANSAEEWHKSKAEFERLKAGGFEECLPL